MRKIRCGMMRKTSCGMMKTSWGMMSTSWFMSCVSKTSMAVTRGMRGGGRVCRVRRGMVSRRWG